LDNEDSIDLIELTTQRKRQFTNALLDIMKEHHKVCKSFLIIYLILILFSLKNYLGKLNPPIVIDKEEITRWHPEFDVESVTDIVPASLPKIEIDKPKIATAKDILGLYTIHYI